MTCQAGCLAEYLEDLLDAGQELLSQLPWTWKAPLLAVARRTVRPSLVNRLVVVQDDTFPEQAKASGHATDKES